MSYIFLTSSIYDCDTGPTFLSDADFSLEKYPVFKYERKSIVDYPGNNVNKSYDAPSYQIDRSVFQIIKRLDKCGFKFIGHTEIDSDMVFTLFKEKK